MKYISIKICLVIAALFGGVAGASDLPDCPSSKNAYRHNCFGYLDNGNGTEYFGEFKNGKYHGVGIYTESNGYNYEGEFQKGKMHGQGEETFGGGSKYVGQFKDFKYSD